MLSVKAIRITLTNLTLYFTMMAQSVQSIPWRRLFKRSWRRYETVPFDPLKESEQFDQFESGTLYLCLQTSFIIQKQICSPRMMAFTDLTGTNLPWHALQSMVSAKEESVLNTAFSRTDKCRCSWRLTCVQMSPRTTRPPSGQPGPAVTAQSESSFCSVHFLALASWNAGRAGETLDELSHLPGNPAWPD